jgi:hypothetical protein
MALIVETGLIVAEADSYISQADATTYFSTHDAPALWTAASTDTKDAALRFACRWLDARYPWLGSIVDIAQPLAWPRGWIVDNARRPIASTTIPTRIKDAQCEAALAHLTSTLDEVRKRGGEIQSVTLPGGLGVVFSASATAGRTFPYIDSLVSLYVVSSPGTARLVRA